MQTRPTTRLVRKMASYARKHSRRQIAIRFGITDPEGKPSKSLVTLLLNGYEPKRPETRTRLGLPAEIKYPRPRVIKPDPIVDEPVRRVLTGAWKTDHGWVSPEEYFKLKREEKS